jgi:two-component system sensor histidine kinase PrrB
VRALRSLRGRVAFAATLAVALVLAIVGAVVVASFAERERARIDDSLRARPAPPILRAVGGGRTAIPLPPPPDGESRRPFERPAERPPPFGPPALRPRGEFVRLIVGTAAARSVDAPEGLPLLPGPGLRTLRLGERSYRSLARPIAQHALLEVGVDLGPVQQRIAALRRLLLALGLLGVGLAGVLSWWLAGFALRPLRALRQGAGRVSGTRDLSTRLSLEDAPQEVDELSTSINAMLARLERSASETEAALEATRRFAADAGHELRTPMTALRARLGALRRNPQLDAGERAATLEAAERDAGRIVRLLDSLQTLARGDAGAALPRDAVDLSAVVDAAIDAARARHPDVAWRLRESDGDLGLDGWPDGLRALVDNLLENAARHGHAAAGTVEVALERDDGVVVLTVDDDGPGVAAADRDRIFERFTRGADARSDGSGLGLALVRQQARLHGGDVTVTESPLGGARFRVHVPADGTGGA